MTSIFQQMEDDLNFSWHGRRPQFFRKWKKTSIFQEIEDGHNFRKWKTTSIFQEMEDDLNFSGNGRWPHYFRKWMMTSIFQEMEDDLNFRKWKMTSICKEMEDYFMFTENGRPRQSVIPNISELFIFQLNQSQPSLTWAQPQLVFLSLGLKFCMGF
jgi:hypothetical protein